MRPRDLWITGFVLFALVGAGQYLFPQMGKTCQSDPDHSTDQLITLQPKCQYRLPNDVAIEPGHIRWRVISSAAWLSYPDVSLPHYTLQTGQTGAATCRVKDAKGKWWIVDVAGSRRNGGSHYIPEDSVAWERTL